MDNKLDDQLRELRDIFDGPIAAALRARDQELAQAREETTRLKAKLERTKGHHAKQRSENAEVEQQVFDEIAQELDKAREEMARLKGVLAYYGNATERAWKRSQKARAERDAAVEALTWYRNQKLIRLRYEQGGISEEPDAERVASEALARLPHAAERAQAQRDVVAAAWKQLTDESDTFALEKALDKLARLDALEQGEQTKGETK